MTDDRVETKGRFLGLNGSEWGLWIQWVLATAGGGLLGLLIGGLAFWGIASRWDEDASMPMLLVSVATAFASLAVSAVVGVAGIGTAQWLVLRGRIHRAGWWVVATTVGGIAGVIAGVVVGIATSGVVATVLDVGGVQVVSLGVAMVVGGAVGGTAQWLVLRSWVRRAGWWIGSTIVGVGMGGLVGGIVLWAIADTIAPGSMVTDVAALSLGPITGGIVIGAVTGFVLVTLLRRPRQSSASHQPAVQNEHGKTRSAVTVRGEEGTG